MGTELFPLSHFVFLTHPLHRLLNESQLELLAFQVRAWSKTWLLFPPHVTYFSRSTFPHIPRSTLSHPLTLSLLPSPLHSHIPHSFTQRAIKEFVLSLDDAFAKQFEEFNVGFEGR